MILQSDEQNPANGALIAGSGGHWRMFPAPTELSILAGGPNINTSGAHPFDLVWLGPGSIPPLQIAQITTQLATVTTADITTLNAGTGAFSGGIAAWGATVPSAQPATTGTTAGMTANSGPGLLVASTFTGGTGSSAYTIGDIVLALKQLGLLAP